MAIVGSILVDLTFLEGHAFRDLDLYLKAGLHFRLGQPVYLDGLVSARPPDPTDYPFVYPPPTLPIAAVLSLLPVGLVTIGWLAAMVAAALVGLHRIGLRGWWLIALPGLAAVRRGPLCRQCGGPAVPLLRDWLRGRASAWSSVRS